MKLTEFFLSFVCIFFRGTLPRYLLLMPGIFYKLKLGGNEAIFFYFSDPSFKWLLLRITPFKWAELYIKNFTSLDISQCKNIILLYKYLQNWRSFDSIYKNIKSLVIFYKAYFFPKNQESLVVIKQKTQVF